MRVAAENSLARALGTSSIVDEKTHQPLRPILSRIVGTVVQLRNEGHKVVLVSSGAIGLGLRRMDMEKRPKQLARVQVGIWCIQHRPGGTTLC